MSSDEESVFESIHDTRELLLTKDFVDELTSKINYELTCLNREFGFDPFSRLIPLIVDALASLVDCCEYLQELTESRNVLAKDLRCLEKQFDKEKEYRRLCEFNLLQIEYENEEERRRLNKIVHEQDQLIRTLKCQLKKISDEGDDLEENVFLEDFQKHDSLLRENDALLKERSQLLERIAQLESEGRPDKSSIIDRKCRNCECGNQLAEVASSRALAGRNGTWGRGGWLVICDRTVTMATLDSICKNEIV